MYISFFCISIRKWYTRSALGTGVQTCALPIYSRDILSETLLVWLETRDSAPASAARLGVHPQTVRYRWKRINELFGEDLHDPEFVLQMTMLLKASVPMWIAGDQSDFERFRANEGG